MRLYQDAMEMVKEVERDLFEMGVRYQTETVQDQAVKNDPKFRTIELFGYGYTLTGYRHLNDIIDYFQLNKTWMMAENQERLFGLERLPLNPGAAWVHNEDFWGRFLRDNKFAYSYAERWQKQIPYIVNELLLRPYTRQTVMTMYDQHQDMMNWGGRDRVPCSLTYQFMIRNNKLHLIYNQRSCDFIKFFGTDVWLTVNLLQHVAERVGVETGNFVHFLGSLHAFAGDLEDRGIF